MNDNTVTTKVDTKVLAGAPLRDALLAQVTQVIAELGSVRLTIVLVGGNIASETYIKHKLAACAKVGIQADVVRLSEADGEAALHDTVRTLATDDGVQAIIVQTPLPRGWDVLAATDLVPAAKDVDGLSSASAALRRAGDGKALLPATPLGVVRLLTVAGVKIAGTKVCVIGKGMVVGAPLREMLLKAGAIVVGIDHETDAPTLLAHECDVIVSAAGAAGLVTDKWVKRGAVVIDVGLTRRDGKLLGDVNRDRVNGMASVVTPVPGGVGPMTVASLLTNIADAACLQVGRARHEWRLDA